MMEWSEIDAFLNDIVAVYKRHGLALGHEDINGLFEVHRFDDELVHWLLNAADARDDSKPSIYRWRD